jgi:pyruvate/2-oxoglutarate dehydrogenase complex dihydrolipoamide dehydrogenase (E3) component
MGDRQIRGRKIIIATGSEPVIPGIEGLTEMGYITYQQATHLATLPESLLILGGGPVGVEFAQLFQCLGVQVTLLQKGNRLIENEEPEISDRIKAVLEQDGVNVQTGCNIDAARCEIRKHQGKQLKCLRTDTQGKEALFSAEEILVAVGMKPRFNALNLEAAGVQADRHGITVNGELQTSNPNIWAVGDVVGPFEFTHLADYQAVIAVHNALRDAHEVVDYRGLGWAVFTEPTVAHVGLTEVEARKEYGNLDIIQSSTDEVSRYRIESEPEGLIKLLVDAKTQQLVGAHLLASNAGDIAHMLMLAIRNHMTAQQLLDVVYIYPAKAQLIQKVLEKYCQGKRKMALGV